jgi:hypothetical protein
MAASRNSKSSRISKRFAYAPPWRLVIALVAVSTLAIAFFYSRGYLLWFGDAAAHLNIARRIVDGRNPGYEQIGTVWLPLTHVLMAPFAAVDGLWQSGLAGSIPSAMGWVAACLLLYAASARVLQCTKAALAATLLFALNPNLLYLQSIPMTEGIYVFSLMLTLYATVKGTGWLAGLGLLAGTLTRYETWFLIPFVAGYLALANRKEALIAGILAAVGPLYWMAHNLIYYGDPLEFYRGVGSAKWIFEQGQARADRPSPTYGHLLVALQYYATAARLFTGLPIVIAGGIGAVATLAKRAWWPVLFLALGPIFYVLSMQGSGGEMHVPGLYPNAYYNTRYAMVVLPLAAFCAASLIAWVPQGLKTGSVAILVFAAACPWIFYPQPQNWITWKESEVNSVARRAWTREAAEFMTANYRPGTGIVAHLGDQTAIFQTAAIPLRETVHDGDGLYFQGIIQRPDLFLWQKWVITIRGDALSKAMTAHQGKLPRYVCAKIIEFDRSSAIEIWERGKP